MNKQIFAIVVKAMDYDQLRLYEARLKILIDRCTGSTRNHYASELALVQRRLDEIEAQEGAQ